MTKSLDKILFIPDVHAPYHDKRAMKLVMEVGRKFKPDVIVCIGDLADFFSISSHSKDPNRINELDKELWSCQTILADLESLGASRQIYVEGNHEDRLRRYLQDKAPELFNLINTQSLLKLDDEWEFVPYRRHTRLGKLYLTHDVGVSGKYSVLRSLETFKHSNVTGHSHHFAMHVLGDGVGERMVGAAFGWLGDMKKIDYMSQAKVIGQWALGFGTGYLESNGCVHISPHPIVNYRCVVEGELFTA